MNEEKKNITQQIEEFKNGLYNNPSVDTQCDAGWFDWFCRDTSLAAKTRKLYKKLIKIEPSDKFDSAKTYMFMKNNCPLNGNLYDDFRICDLVTGDVIFCVTPYCGHASQKGQAQVYGRQNNFKKPLVAGTWKEVVAWFLNKEEDLTTKARTVTMLEELDKLAQTCYESDMPWSCVLLTQAMHKIYSESSLAEDDFDWEEASKRLTTLESEVTKSMNLKKRFDGLKAKTCPCCWK